MSEASHSHRSSRFGPLGCLVVGLCVLIVLPVLSVWVYVMRSSARVEAALSEIRDQGEPTTGAELEAYYALPDGAADPTALWLAGVQPLAGPAYAASAKDLPIVGVSQQDVPPPGEPWPQQAAAEAHLTQYAAALAKMHEAAKIGGPARYPTNFDDGFSMVLLHVQNVRGGARLLELEARVRARQGDARGVAESLHAMLMLAESLEREPITVSQLVRFACLGMAMATLEELLPHVDFSDEELARLQADLQAHDARGGLQRALVGERVMGVSAFRDPAAVGELAPSLATKISLTRQDDMTLYLEAMSRFQAAAEKPWPQMLDEAAAAQAMVTDQMGNAPLGRARYAVTGLVLPAMEASFEAVVRDEARMRVAATAVAVERYRREQGKLPANLEQLAPKFLPAPPTDPFDGKPLRYKLLGENAIVYSVGKNLLDDGGHEKDRGGEPDMTFVIRPKTSD